MYLLNGQQINPSEVSEITKVFKIHSKWEYNVFLSGVVYDSGLFNTEVEANNSRQLLIDAVDASGGGGGSTLSVYDEGSLTVSVTNKLNFIGTDVVVFKNGADSNQADIYIPTIDFSSNYNSNLKATDALVINPSTTNRNISSPTTEGNPFKTGGWNLGIVHPSIKDASINFSTLEENAFEDVLSTITVNVYDPDGIISTYTSTAISGNFDNTTNNIRIRVTSWASEEFKYKGKIIVDVDIASIIPNGGRFYVEIKHNNSVAGVFTYTGQDIFYDNEPNVQTISNVSISNNTLSSNKWLSGIRYYDKNDSFNIGIGDIDYLNSNTYPNNLVNILSNSLYGIADFWLSSIDLTNWTNIYNNINASYSSIKSITEDAFRYIGTSGFITGRVYDWIAGSSSQSINKYICIDTYLNESDVLSEYFIDENFRKTASNNTWVSTNDMTSYDDNLGLMIQNGVIKTRRTDWNVYEPGLLTNPDYTGFTGWGTYYRNFTDNQNLVRGSATLTVSGFTLQNLIDEDVKLFVLIPGRWGNWCYVHGANEFDFGTFDGNDDPIRLNSSTTNSIKISFGNLGLNSTYNNFRIRLEIQNTNIQPSSIVVSW
jgi:hypothetical protein